LSSVIFQIAGTAIGYAVGGPLGASIGGAIGGFAGQEIFGSTPTAEGPRVTNRLVQTSTYGLEIARVYGTARLAGNVIWSTDLIEQRNSQEVGDGKGGGGGAEIVTYTYRVSCAVSVCRGPVTGIKRIWADSMLIYDVSSDNDGRQENFSAGYFKIYNGSEDQEPDPLIQSFMGDTPAYRGQAYVVFGDFQLEKFGNRLPSFTFEVFNGDFIDRKYRKIVELDSTSVSNHTIDPVSGYMWVIDNTKPSKIFVVDIIDKVVIAELEGTTSMSNPRPYTNLAYDPVDRVFLGIGGYSETTLRSTVDIFSTQSLSFIKSFETRYAGIGDFRQNLIFVNPEFGIAPYWTGNALGAGTRLLGYSRNGDFIGLFGVFINYTESLYIPEAGVIIVGNGNDFFVKNARSTADLLRINNSSNYAINLGDSPKIAYDSKRNRLLWISFDSEYTLIDLNTLTYEVGYFDMGDDGLANNTILYHKQTDQYILAAFLSFSGTALLSIYDAETITLQKQIQQTGLNGDITVLTENPNYKDRVFGAKDNGIYEFFLTPVAESIPKQLSTVITDESSLVGINVSDLDLSLIADKEIIGYAIPSSNSIRASIEPLLVAYQIDAVQSGARLKFVPKKDAPIIDIDPDDLGMHDFGSQPPEPFPVSRLDELELPRSVTVKYQNQETDYQISSQASYRLDTKSNLDLIIDLPLVIESQQAKELAEVGIYSSWTTRTKTKLLLPVKYLNIEPTDTLRVNRNLVRVTKKQLRGNIVEVDCDFENANVYSQPAFAANPFPVRQQIPLIGSTNLQFIDSIALRDVDTDPCFYIAAGGFNSGWGGCVVFKSPDNGETWIPLISITTEATIGGVVEALPEYETNVWDNQNTLTVNLTSGAGLFSGSHAGVIGGLGNAALVGNEIIQFKTAQQIGPKTYRISGFLRGRRGSSTKNHEKGERFVLLNIASLTKIPLNISEIGVPYVYKAVTIGRTQDTAVPVYFTAQGNTLKPLSPVKLSAGRDSAGNIKINWFRRGRIGGWWRDYVDVPIGESTEQYLVKIFDNGNVVRQITTATNSADYSAAQQVIDFGGTQSQIEVEVSQVNDLVGSGFTISGSV
jgi:hypothetical protein